MRGSFRALIQVVADCFALFIVFETDPFEFFIFDNLYYTFFFLSQNLLFRRKWQKSHTPGRGQLRQLHTLGVHGVLRLQNCPDYF